MANRKNTFLLKRSNVAGNIPSAGQILLGELALNTADVILYASGTTTNSILPIGWDRVHRTGDTMTGPLIINSDLTVTGNTILNTLTATTISATTFYGDGSNLTGISGSTDFFVTGGTYSAGTLTLERGNGSVVVTGFTNNVGYLLQKSGLVSGSTFAGNPKTFSVTFSTPFPNNNYSITISADVNRTWTWQSKTASGFTISANANPAFNTSTVSWIALENGEGFK